MSDAELRELERATKASPCDVAALERLDLARFRMRLGWHGEALPIGIEPLTNERGVYLAELPVDPPPGGAPIPRVFVDLVYVPGGEVECDMCHRGTYPITTALYVEGNPKTCARCRSTGVIRTAPFYIGRFPLTWREWAAFWRVEEARDPDRRRELTLAADPDGVNAHYPVVNVSHADAIAFCSWAGLRLPSDSEWNWAALGAGIETLICLKPDCMTCSRRLVPRRYPWGSEPPRPDLCVWSGHPEYGVGRYLEEDMDPGMVFRLQPGSTAPVVIPERCLVSPPRQSIADGGSRLCEHGFALCAKCDITESGRLLLARPRGASWCGAHDMAGNVWEWTKEGTPLGGSFRTEVLPMSGRWWSPGVVQGAPDDVGLRVALSAPQ